jgi:hypothetical protein
MRVLTSALFVLLSNGVVIAHPGGAGHVHEVQHPWLGLAVLSIGIVLAIVSARRKTRDGRSN